MTCTEPSLFVTDPEFGYQEFACRDEDHFQFFRVQVRRREGGWWLVAMGLCLLTAAGA